MRVLLKVLTGRVLARFVAAGLQALLIVTLARDLGPGIFGSFAWTTSVGAIAGVVLGFGTNSVALRVSRYPNQSERAGVLMWAGVFSAMGSAAAAIGISGVVGGTQVVQVVVAAAILVGGDMANEVMVSTLSGLGRFGLATQLLLLRRSLPLALLYALRPVADTSDAMLLAAIVSLAPTALYTLRQQRPSWEEARWLAREGRGYWGASMASQVTALDITIVRASLGVHAAGLYGAASRCVSPLNIVSSSIVGILVPLMATDPDGELAARRRTLRLMSVGVALVVAAASPGIAYVVTTVLGPQYYESKGLIEALSIAIGISCISQVLQTELLVAGRPQAVTRGIFVGAAIGMTVLWLVARTVGFEAVGPVLVATQLLIACLLYVGASMARHSDREVVRT